DPANLFVAGFIGSPAMNFLDARLDGASVRIGAVRIGDVRIGDGGGDPGAGTLGVQGAVKVGGDPRVSDGGGVGGGGRVTLGLRPERIALAAPSAGTPARVDIVEPMGLGTVVHVSVAEQHLKVFTTGRVELRPGDTVGLGIQPPDLLLFDPRTGERLRDWLMSH
ncbi:MAG TPA: TOBE domain-containing protein, partial [Steroidobacteraceae bacterium]|nr:TOBE domain-containing protein [Steroidobacteraceae bacterium]